MIYLLILLIIIGFSLRYDFRGAFIVTAKNPYVFLCLCLILLAGLRFYVGSDTHNYVYDFSVMPNPSNLFEYHRLESRYQFGWDSFVCVIKSCFENFVFVQLITATIVNVGIFWFIKRNTTNVFIAVMFYFILNYFEYNMEIMREAIAVVLGLVAVAFYEKGRKLYFVLFLLLSFEFHISAIILATIPFITKIKYSKKLLIITILLSVIVPILFTQIHGLANLINLFTASNPEYLLHYLNQSIDNSRNIFYYLELYVSYLVIPILCLASLKNNKNTNYTGMIIVFIILRCLGMFTYAFYRFGNYFAPFYWILLADATYYYWKRLRIPKQLLIIVMTLCFMFIYQREQLSNYPAYPNHKLYERYIPYEMVNSSNHNYSISKSKYFFRNGTHD